MKIKTKIEFLAVINDDKKTCNTACEYLDYECGAHEGWCAIDSTELCVFGDLVEARIECCSAAEAEKENETDS